MSVKDRLIEGLNKTISLAGKPICIKYYTQTIGSVWDDDVVLSQSGNDFWTSGVIFPVVAREGSQEAVLVEQGKLMDQDKILFLTGDTPTVGSEFQVKIGLGSPVAADQEFTTITIGEINPEVEATKVYKKVFIRRLTTGSLTGE